MRRSSLLASLLLALAALVPALAQPGPAAPFVTHQLAPNVYWVEGGGSNSGVLVGDHGVIVIDAKVSPEGGRQLLDAIARITPKPVTTVLLTHSDGDHINGLAAFPKGIAILAHPNNAAEQKEALARGGWGAPAADRLPTDLVASSPDTRTIDGIQLQLFHWASAHTSGDLVVYLPQQKIVFTGDLITLNFPSPLIHLEKHGSSDGWIASVQAMLALDAAQYVPGHGDVQTKAQLEPRLQAAIAEKAEIRKLVAEGKTLAQVQDAVNDPPKNATGAPGTPHFPAYSEVVYRELTAPAAH